MASRDVQDFLAELSEWVSADGRLPQTHRYGSGPEHDADLLIPTRDGDGDVGGGGPGSGGDGPGRVFPVAMLVHGGFWRARFTRAIMSALAIDLADRGWASWNIEYRRIGSGGGPSEMIEDVHAALQALTGIDAPLDLGRLLVIGHSAGGQLGLCVASASPSASQSTVAGVVSLAGVCDLVSAARERIGDSAALELVGGTPDERPEAYVNADPLKQLPTGARVLLVHGDADDRVPIEQSRTYAQAARAAGDSCELLELAGVDHFDLIDPRSEAWATIAGRLESLVR